MLLVIVLPAEFVVTTGTATLAVIACDEKPWLTIVCPTPFVVVTTYGI